jgi:hypothetical protein
MQFALLLSTKNIVTHLQHQIEKCLNSYYTFFPKFKNIQLLFVTKQRNRITEVNTAIRTEGNLDPEEVSSMRVLSSGFGAMRVGKKTTFHTIVLGGWKEPITKR